MAAEARGIGSRIRQVLTGRGATDPPPGTGEPVAADGTDGAAPSTVPPTAPPTRGTAKKTAPKKAPAKKTADKSPDKKPGTEKTAAEDTAPRTTAKAPAKTTRNKAAPATTAPATTAPETTAPDTTAPDKTMAASGGAPAAAAGTGGGGDAQPVGRAAKAVSAAGSGPRERAAPPRADERPARADPAPAGPAPAEPAPADRGTSRPDEDERAPAPADGALAPPGEEWTADELATIRADLEALGRQYRQEMAHEESALAEVRREGADGAGDDTADAGTKTFERAQEISLADNRRDLLNQVEHALGRLRAGTYGRCESCGRPIAKARLQAFPSATLCRECKQREERR